MIPLPLLKRVALTNLVAKSGNSFSADSSVLSEIRLNSLGVRILNVVPGRIGRGRRIGRIGRNYRSCPGGKINNLGQERDVGDRKGQEGLGKDMERYGGIWRDREG